MPNFVEFDREDSHFVPDEPMFTLQKRGLISMNQAAFKALGEPVTVALLYDADEGIVAMRKVPRTYHNGYHIRKQNAARSYLVAATGFTSYNKINTDVSRRHLGHVYDDQVVGFVLAEGRPIKGQTRKPKASVHDIREADHSTRRPANGLQLMISVATHLNAVKQVDAPSMKPLASDVSASASVSVLQLNSAANES